ncbi:MAG: hypothetical protein HY685_02950 [Chloroflexi bacterium]|nr:hypothetical protein [Chloroflexota bacterium]
MAITALFTLPVLVALAVALAFPPDDPRARLLAAPLGFLGISIAPVVLMLAVEASFHRRPVSVFQAVLASRPWIVRYLWTNAHSTIIFWIPVEGMIILARWQTETYSLPEPYASAGIATWGAVIGASALYIHTRTSLAPYLAIHSRLPGTLAFLYAWRLSRGRRFWRTLAVVVTASLPGLLAGGLAGLLLVLLAEARLQELWPVFSQTWGLGIIFLLQLIRPLLIPAMHCLYSDALAEDSQAESENPFRLEATLPAPLRVFLALARRFAQTVAPVPLLGAFVPPGISRAGDDGSPVAEPPLRGYNT